MNHEESLKGSPIERVEIALDAIKSGNGVIVTDDEDRENEGDMIFSSEHLTEEQMKEAESYAYGSLLTRRMNWNFH